MNSDFSPPPPPTIQVFQFDVKGILLLKMNGLTKHVLFQLSNWIKFITLLLVEKKIFHPGGATKTA